nr:RNA-directed DNA polymerase, eukaryota, reverse transcriptase zinc-binding domain protein [Tanacetum cinerariifolium]
MFGKRMLLTNALYVRPINRSIWSILQRLVIGSMVYFIWLERNLRRFQDKRRLAKDLCGIIRGNVRLRLMSLKIRKSVQVMEAAKLWYFGVEEFLGQLLCDVFGRLRYSHGREERRYFQEF